MSEREAEIAAELYEYIPLEPYRATFDGLSLVATLKGWSKQELSFALVDLARIRNIERDERGYFIR